jgi:hypothetical protein
MDMESLALRPLFTDSWCVAERSERGQVDEPRCMRGALCEAPDSTDDILPDGQGTSGGFHLPFSTDLVPISVALGHRSSNDNTCSGSSWLVAQSPASATTTPETTSSNPVEGFRRLRHLRSEEHSSASSLVAATDAVSPST